MINQDISLDLYLGSIRLTRSHIQFLKYYYDNEFELLPQKSKFITDLNKMGYVHNAMITDKGHELMIEVLEWDGIYTPNWKNNKKKIEYTKEFTDLWDLYPSIDSFDEFEGVRVMKDKKEKCFVEYEKICEENNWSLVEMAVQYHLELTKELSRKEGKNKLTYLPQFLRYLTERRFEPYLGKGLFKSKDDKKEIIDTNNLF